MDNLTQALEAGFAEATRIYRERGFQRRVGFGNKPALINVDLANAWTRPGNPFTCDDIDEQIIPAVQHLLGAFRKYGFPVVFTTTAYQVTDRTNPNTDMGLWHEKIPVEVCAESNKSLVAIDSRIAPLPGEENQRNNKLLRLINVDDRVARVLYMEGEPRWEFKFLRRAVEDVATAVGVLFE